MINVKTTSGVDMLRSDCRAHISTMNVLVNQGLVTPDQVITYKQEIEKILNFNPNYVEIFRGEDLNLNQGVDVNNPKFKIGDKIIIYGSESQKQHMAEIVEKITTGKKKLYPTTKMLEILTNLKGEIKYSDFGLVDEIEGLILNAKNLGEMKECLKAYKVYKLCLKEFGIITEAESDKHSEELGELIKNENPDLYKLYKSAKGYI